MNGFSMRLPVCARMEVRSAVVLVGLLCFACSKRSCAQADTDNVVPTELTNPATLQLPALDRDFADSVLDVSRMTVVKTKWWGRNHTTRLHQDRALRNLGLGDLGWATGSGWIAFRGARLVELDEDLEEAEALPLAVLKSRLVKQGRVTLNNGGESSSVAIQTAEGHIAVFKVANTGGGDRTIEIHRLTSDADAHMEEPNDGADVAAWGTAVDGFQAGIVYRTAAADKKWQAIVGESVPVKLFVRNVGREPKDYSWQIPEQPERAVPRVPLCDTWRPVLFDAARKPVPMSPLQKPYKVALHTVTLQPGESVLVGAAAIALWSKIDVGFGDMESSHWERRTAVIVSRGEYRLAADVDTGLISRPKLRTGELSLIVIDAENERLEVLAELDGLSSHSQRRHEEFHWCDIQNDSGIRPALPPDNVEYLSIPCLAYDSDSRQPIAGAVARIEIFSAIKETDATRESESLERLCAYEIVTDSEGRYVVQIPQRLLTGHTEGWQAGFRVHLSHPRYNPEVETFGVEQLLDLGLIEDDGVVKQQGQQPQWPLSRDDDKLGAFQRIAVRRGRTLSGRLIGKGHVPAPNDSIYGGNSEGRPVVIKGETDSEGRFRFNVPAKSEVDLKFHAGKFGKVTPDQTELGDIIRAGVRGQVLDDAGQPVADMSVSTPPVLAPVSQPDNTSDLKFSFTVNTSYTTDANGWFETEVLQPGVYQVELKAYSMPNDGSGSRTLVPPSDLYVPFRFEVKRNERVADLTLRPSKAAMITAKLITTVPKAVEGELPHVIDPLAWKATLEMMKRERAKSKAVKSTAENQDNSPVKMEVDEDADASDFLESEEDQQSFLQQWIIPMAMTPTVGVKGKMADQSWSRNPDWSELEDLGDSAEFSFKIPRELSDATVESAFFTQHVQIGNGPKLFGKSIRIGKTDVDRIEVKLYRYQPTTLKVVFVTADGMSVVMKDNELPRGLSTRAKYVREDEMRKAGATFESSETLMFRSTMENSVLHFVIPGEEIELTVTSNGKEATRRFTLKDGETRTAAIRLRKDLEWFESSQPTPRLNLKQIPDSDK